MTVWLAAANDWLMEVVDIQFCASATQLWDCKLVITIHKIVYMTYASSAELKHSVLSFPLL